MPTTIEELSEPHQTDMMKSLIDALENLPDGKLYSSNELVNFVTLGINYIRDNAGRNKKIVSALRVRSPKGIFLYGNAATIKQAKEILSNGTN